jgi:hypothetical protein
MTFHISHDGFDGEPKLNFDSLGKLYISIAIVWTTIVVYGAGFLLRNRGLPALRVRNTRLWIATVAFLHCYWVLCLLAYVINGLYPCSAEFWIMSLWLPFGIALYQVNGMHLLHIASLQTRFIHPQALYAYRGPKSVRSGLRSLRIFGLPDTLSRVQKISIVAGVVLQVSLLGSGHSLNTHWLKGFRQCGNLHGLEEVSSFLGSSWACRRARPMSAELGVVRLPCLS